MRTASNLLPGRHLPWVSSRHLNGSPSLSAPRRREEVSLLIGAWIVASLFADGWAHTHLADLESFFTPWHAALYSGLLVNVAWLAWLSRPRTPQIPAADKPAEASRVTGSAGRYETITARRWAAPAGYGGGVVGAAIFGVGGMADMAWHSAWGVEVGLDALLSPPHLILLMGALLLVTSPWRARYGDPATSVPARTSLLLAVALMAFFLMYTSEFASPALLRTYVRLPEQSPAHEAGETGAVLGLGRFLITTMLYTAPLLLIWRRPRIPTCSISFIIFPLATLSVAMSDAFGPALVGAIGASVGALAADSAIALLQRRRLLQHRSLPLRLPVLASAATCCVWSGHTAALLVASNVQWPLELTLGVIVLSALIAAMLGYVASGSGPFFRQQNQLASRKLSR